METNNYKRRSGIKIARERKNLTSVQLASLLNIDTAVLRNWELGISIIPLQTLIKLSNILEVSTEMLLFCEERPSLEIESLTNEQKDCVRKLYKNLKTN